METVHGKFINFTKGNRRGYLGNIKFENVMTEGKSITCFISKDSNVKTLETGFYIFSCWNSNIYVDVKEATDKYITFEIVDLNGEKFNPDTEYVVASPEN